MLFNSTFFIAIFLPIALVGWYILKRLKSPLWGRLFLTCMSFWFYGYYNLSYVWLLLASILMNYLISLGYSKTTTSIVSRLLLALGIVGNLGLLFYYKYFNFFIDNCNLLFKSDIRVAKIALPLGISFFTFQQLSYCIERYYGRAEHENLLNYSCFVSFFPQLVAGPIVLHSEFLPQLKESNKIPFSYRKFYDGLSLFILGLAKKVLLADSLALYVNAEYANIAYLDMPAAWMTIIFYMLELYFDFSGYCDMARGIAKLFGFELPSNFDSPLMASSVKDFWRRWHITLSRFLMTYIYIPLGGNRKGRARQCINLFIVFLVSGIWHGANWTFIIWGILHGLAVIFETVFPKLRFPKDWMNRVLTFVYVTFTFSIFRADSVSDAILLIKRLFSFEFTGMLKGMSCTLNISEIYAVGKMLELKAPSLLLPMYLVSMFLLLLFCFLFIRGKKAEEWLEKSYSSFHRIFLLSVLFVWSFISLSSVSTFLYFNF